MSKYTDAQLTQLVTVIGATFRKSLPPDFDFVIVVTERGSDDCAAGYVTSARKQDMIRTLRYVAALAADSIAEMN